MQGDTPAWEFEDVFFGALIGATLGGADALTRMSRGDYVLLMWLIIIFLFAIRLVLEMAEFDRTGQRLFVQCLACICGLGAVGFGLFHYYSESLLTEVQAVVFFFMLVLWLFFGLTRQVVHGFIVEVAGK